MLPAENKSANPLGPTLVWYASSAVIGAVLAFLFEGFVYGFALNSLILGLAGLAACGGLSLLGKRGGIQDAIAYKLQWFGLFGSAFAAAAGFILASLWWKLRLEYAGHGLSLLIQSLFVFLNCLYHIVSRRNDRAPTPNS